MARGLRYTFQGSTFQVQTGYEGSSPSKIISGITQANPGVVSSTAHGFTLGDVVRASGIVGMTELNGNVFVVDNPDTGDFEMADTDTSLYDAYISGGVLDEIDFSEFCELTSASQADGTTDQVEVTTICSTGKEFVAGLSDSGTLTMDYNFAPNSPVMIALRAAKAAGEELAFKITLPTDGGIVIMLGTIESQSFQGAVAGAWTGSTSVKLSGPMFILPAA